MLGILPGVAQAACTRAQRADVGVAMRVAAQLRTARAGGAADVTAVVARARRRCDATRFARAVAVATSRLGSPRLGRRASLLGIDLVGVPSGGGTAWRMDAPRLAGRVVAARTPARATAHRRVLATVAFGTGRVVWSDDPTRVRWDHDRQALVSVLLARSAHPDDRARVAAAVRAVALGTRAERIAAEPVIDQLLVANRLVLAAHLSRSSAARGVASEVALAAYQPLRAAVTPTWSRIDGRWSTLAEHRLLAARSAGLLRRVPHAATAGASASLARSLVTAPVVEFTKVPTSPFYPWPADGAYDTAGMSMTVDKPGTTRIAIYGLTGAVVRLYDMPAEPGAASIEWGGTDSHGRLLQPGEYRYGVEVRDFAGNRTVLPGLGEFHIARDEVAPRVRTVAVRHVTGGTLPPRIIASWNVVEEHSPRVRTWLVLVRPGQRVSLRLDQQARRRTVRRVARLRSGTWRGTFVFLDGSGNRTSGRAGNIVVR